MQKLFFIFIFFTPLLISGCKTNSTKLLNGYIEGEYRLLASEETGVIVETKVKKGAFVKKGEILALIEPTATKLSIKSAETIYQSALNSFNRAKEFVKKDFISQAAFESATVEFEKAKATYETAKWHLKEHAIDAPEDGFVQNILRQTGEIASPQNPVIYFLPKAGIKVRFFIPENQLSSITLGQEIFVTNSTSQKVKAKISYISNQPEYTPPIIYSQTERSKLVFLVEASLLEPTNVTLHPGQPIDVILETANE